MVYASVAWLLIQLVNNLLPPLNLPTIVSTIVIIALAVGFPLAIILAWIYQLTPEAIEETRDEEPGAEIFEDEEEGVEAKVKDVQVMEAAKYVLPVKGVDFKELEKIFGESGFVAAYEEAMRQLEELAKKGYSAPVEMAYRYLMADQADKAMEWLEKGFEAHDPVMPYLATKMFLFEPLYDNPRFIDLLQKMKLPLPGS